VIREGVGAGGEMTQALYAHMNNKIFLKSSIANQTRFKSIKGLFN
jgi:NaMN:DMB phosphoribosyltransferase